MVRNFIPWHFNQIEVSLSRFGTRYQTHLSSAHGYLETNLRAAFQTTLTHPVTKAAPQPTHLTLHASAGCNSETPPSSNTVRGNIPQRVLALRLLMLQCKLGCAKESYKLFKWLRRLFLGLEHPWNQSCLHRGIMRTTTPFRISFRNMQQVSYSNRVIQ